MLLTGAAAAVTILLPITKRKQHFSREEQAQPPKSTTPFLALTHCLLHSFCVQALAVVAILYFARFDPSFLSLRAKQVCTWVLQSNGQESDWGNATMIVALSYLTQVEHPSVCSPRICATLVEGPDEASVFRQGGYYTQAQ